MPGRQVHSFVPLRRTRSSPLGDEGQSTSVASLVINVSPALSASAIFPASVAGMGDSAFCAKAQPAIKRAIAINLISERPRYRVRIPLRPESSQLLRPRDWLSPFD